MKDKFKKNVNLDAGMVLAGMKGGIDGVMNWGYMHRAEFPTTNLITERAEWLKTQDEEYIKQVSEKAAYLEKNKIVQ